MTVRETPLPGAVVLDLDVYEDERGWFMEMWNAERYQESGIDARFVQDNLSRSQAGVLRGLHFQNPHSQAKIVSVLEGEVYDVIVDVRPESPTFCDWFGMTLSGDRPTQLFVPEGFAHGFVVTGETALFHYKCTALYAPDADRSIRWDDPQIGVDWPVDDPIVSDKDAGAPLLRELPDDVLQFGSAQASKRS